MPKMNLFGGFKAKFTRKSKSKDNFEHVVCTKYKINSEFLDDAPISFKHNPRIRQTKTTQPIEKSNKLSKSPSLKQLSQSLHDLRHLDVKSEKDDISTPKQIRKTESVFLPTAKSSPVKIRPPYPLPEVTSEPELHHDYDEPLESPTKIKSEELRIEELSPLTKTKPSVLMFNQNEYDEPDENILNFSSTDKLPNKSSSPLTVKDNISEIMANGDLVHSKEVIKTNSLYFEGPLDNKKPFTFTTATDDYEEITPGEEYKVTFPLSEKDLEPLTLILMTQPSMEATPESSNKGFEFINGHTNDPEDDFKVNVVQYDYKTNYSISEDEVSTDGLGIEDIKDYTPMGYTSQAASIFFGVDLDPPTPKPRKITLKSTTNEEEEEDC